MSEPSDPTFDVADAVASAAAAAEQASDLFEVADDLGLGDAGATDGLWAEAPAVGAEDPSSVVDTGFADLGADPSYVEPDHSDPVADVGDTTYVDPGYVDPGVDAGYVDPGVDAGYVDPGVDAGYVDPGADAGYVDPGYVDPSYVDTSGGYDAGAIDTSGGIDTGYDPSSSWAATDIVTDYYTDADW